MNDAQINDVLELSKAFYNIGGGAYSPQMQNQNLKDLTFGNGIRISYEEVKKNLNDINATEDDIEIPVINKKPEEIDIDKYIKDNNFEQVSDEGIVIEAVEKVFAANGQSISDYLDGKTKAFGYLVGQTMRELKGKADPAIVNKIIQDKLDNM